jgi:hypothetical protein
VAARVSARARLFLGGDLSDLAVHSAVFCQPEAKAGQDWALMRAAGRLWQALSANPWQAGVAAQLPVFGPELIEPGLQFFDPVPERADLDGGGFLEAINLEGIVHGSPSGGNSGLRALCFRILGAGPNERTHPADK